MRIDNLTANVLQNVQSDRPFNKVSFLNTPYNETFKLRAQDDDASAAEIQHPGSPEKPAVQLGGSAGVDLDSLAWLSGAPGQARRSHGNLAAERVLHLLK